MNSSSYFVLYLTITSFLAQCQKQQQGEEDHESRRPLNQTFTTPAQQYMSRLIQLTNKPVVNFEVLKHLIRDLHEEAGREPQDKQSTKTVTVMSEAKKKAIRERFWRKEKMDALEMERKKVEELTQNVERMRKELRAKKRKKKDHAYMNNNGEMRPIMRAN